MKAILNKYNTYFIAAEAHNGKIFYKLNDEAPEALRDFVKAVHFDYFDGCWPNDWIYENILDAFEALEYDTIDNCIIEADIYTSDLMQWMQQPFASTYVDEAKAEFGKTENIEKQIGQGQWLARDRIYNAVNHFIEENPLQEKEGQI